MRTILSLSVCLGLALGTASGIAQAAERTDFLVNDDGGQSEQNHSRIAAASDGSFVIVWMDRRSGSADIYLQRYDSESQPVGFNLKVNDDQVDAFQADPAVQIDLHSHYALVWQDFRNGQYPFDPDIFLQPYDSNLTPSGNNRNVTESQPDSLKGSPDLAVSGWGGGLVVWSDYRNRNWDIYGQLVTTDGSPLGGNFKINNDVGSAQQHSPRIDVSPEGWYVVVWYDNRTGNDDIFAQRIDSLGSFLGANFRVNSDGGTARQAFPDVATDGAGHFTVVWVDWRNGNYPSNPDIYSRKFDTLNVPQTSDTRINRDGTIRAQREPSISADRKGNVAIIWADSTGSSWDITGQMIDVDGVVRETNFQANTEADSAQLDPDVALDGSSRYVTWTDKRNGHFDIYASISQYNNPGLEVIPTDLAFVLNDGQPLPSFQTLTINHTGYNPITFEVLSNVDWLDISPSSGESPADLSVGVNMDTLPYGTLFGLLTFVDQDNNDSSVTVTVRLDHPAPITDTLLIADGSVAPADKIAIPLTLTSTQTTKSINIPLSLSSDLMAIDSVTLGDEIVNGTDLLVNLEDSTRVGLYFDFTNADSLLPLGEYELATVHCTAGATNGVVTLEQSSAESGDAYLISEDGSKHQLEVIPGQVIVDAATPAEEPTELNLPDQPTLYQNYPNPFNPSTTIEFSLPYRSTAELEVFNILGQRTISLFSGVLPAGIHNFVWNGQLESDRSAPSGIYFYRLRTDEGSTVRKMVLLK